MRGVLVVVAPAAIPFLPHPLLYVFLPAWGLFAIVALIDLVQRLRYPVVRS